MYDPLATLWAVACQAPLSVGFSDNSVGKESTCNWAWVPSGDSGLIPGLGRSPGGGNGNPFQYSFFFFPFQYSCLENPMDRAAWQVTVHSIAESDTTDQLSLHTCIHTHTHTHTHPHTHFSKFFSLL